MSGSTPLQNFTIFPKLPPEARNMVWTLASLHPRKVNVLSSSTLVEEFRLRQNDLSSIVPSQTRQPAVMEVNGESRAVGTKHYNLIKAALPRCEPSCQRCTVEAWLETNYRSPGPSMSVEFHFIQERLQEKGYRRLQHTISEKIAYNLHWVNFAIDEFALNLTRLEQEHSFHYSTSFNFEKNDLLRIKRLSYQDDINELQEHFFMLMLRQLFSKLNVEEFTLRLVVEEKTVTDIKSGWELAYSHVWRRTMRIFKAPGTGETRNDCGEWPGMRCVLVTASGAELVATPDKWDLQEAPIL